MRTLLAACVIVLLLTPTLCQAEYTLIIQTDPPFITTVDPYVGIGQVSGTIQLNAEPFIACPYVYQFDHWEGPGIADPYAAQTQVVVQSSQAVTAVFVDARTCGDICHPDNAFGDLNHDCIVNLGDVVELAARWLNCTKPECDILPVLIPDSAAWLMEPQAVAGTLNVVEMQAVTAQNIELPSAPIQYFFDCQTDDTYDSGWISNPYYSAAVAPGSYLFTHSARDNQGHQTQPAPVCVVTPGSAFEIPAADWQIMPSYSEPDGSVSMQVKPYSAYPGAPAIPAGYTVAYQFEKDGILMPLQSTTTFTDINISDNTVYSYRARMAVCLTAGGQVVVYGGFSGLADVLVLEDKVPPVPTIGQDPLYPYKAQHAKAPVTFYRSQSGYYYTRVEAVPAEDEASADPTNVEYRFVCSNSTYSSSWRNRDNVAGLTEPDGTPQTPYRYVVGTGIIDRPNYVWYVYYRDRSRSRNVGHSSDGWSAAGPNPVVIVNP